MTAHSKLTEVGKTSSVVRALVARSIERRPRAFFPGGRARGEEPTVVVYRTEKGEVSCTFHARVRS